MSKSKISSALLLLNSKVKPATKTPGYSDGSRNKYMNPLLTPPPRSPQTPEDFRHPEKLGHWYPLGFNWYNPVNDRYRMHELFFGVFFLSNTVFYLWYYGPDFKLRDWSRREAFLRTTKREALGLPLIDRDFVDPERIVLPPEEELENYPVTI